MRLLVLLLALLPSLALAQGPRVVRDLGTVLTGPRVLGEPAFAFEMDALSWDEPDRAGWPITTTRPSSCMTYTGSEWVTRGEDEACVDSQGLQAFEGFTQYATSNTSIAGLIYSGSGCTETALGTIRCEDTSASGDVTVSMSPSQSAVAGETWTSTWEIRSLSGSRDMRFFTGDSSFSAPSCRVRISTEWSRVSCTRTAGGSGSALARVVLGDSGADVAAVEIRQWQLTKTPHPMPRHDCGEAACSRAGDVHAVDATGFPTSSGYVRLHVRLDHVPKSAYLLDTRTAAGDGVLLWSTGNGELDGRVYVGGALVRTVILSGGSWSVGADAENVVEFWWGGDVVGVALNGARREGGGAAPVEHSAAASLGSSQGGGNHLNGHIRLLRVSGGTP